MRRLQPISRDPQIDYQTVCARRRPLATRKLLTDAESDVLAAYVAYAADPQAVGLTRSIAPKNRPSTAALHEGLYGNFSALDRGKRCEDIRSAVLSSATQIHNLCPYCLLNQVGGALDHYLPRHVHAEFSVLHLNLVPICDECNRRKKEKGPSSGHGFMHAYYDDFSREGFLQATARMVRGTVRFSFSLAHPPGMLARDFARISSHFDELDLLERYRSAGAQEMMSAVSDLPTVFDRGGQQGVVAQLEASAAKASWYLGANYWKTATFGALARCDDFCSGGFRPIVDAWT